MGGTYRHGLQHLSGNNNGLSDNVALGNHHLLSKEDLAGRYFNTEVTAGDHDTISLLEDLVKVGNPLLVFNLDNDLDIGTIRTQDSTDLADVLALANEGSENHVNAVLDTKLKILLVLVRQSWEIDISLGKVDTLAGGDIASVESANVDICAIHGEDEKGEDSIIDVDELARGSDLGKVGL